MDPTYAILESPFAFDETVARIEKKIHESGNTVYAKIDQVREAERAGLRLRPTVLFVFGNPKGGVPLMDALPLLALDVPLKALVWQDGANVHVGYNLLQALAARFGPSAMDEALAQLDQRAGALLASALS
jgi:uncharacterized protein (DUF302 family)